MKEDVDLKNLLTFDVRALKTKAEFEEKFKAIAEKLLKEYVLVLEGKEEYRLIEVELYLRDGKIHNDTFTHGVTWERVKFHFLLCAGKEYRLNLNVT